MSSKEDETQDSWMPMIVIAMGQMLMSFNVAALPVSMGGMVESFNTPPTTVGTAIVMYSLGVSGFIMLGAKLGQRFGSKIFFQVAVTLFLGAMITMVISPTAVVMLAAQALAGLAGAALVPTLVVLIANHYRGKQQAEAVGWLGSARAIAGVLAFVIVGTWTVDQLAPGVRAAHRARRRHSPPELQAQGVHAAARSEDRRCRRAARGDGHHLHHLRLQQRAELGGAAGAARGAVRPVRRVAGADA